jgi:hypothetical protein
VEALLARARELRRGLGTAAPAPGAAATPAAAVEADPDAAPEAPALLAPARSRDADDPGPAGDPSEDPDAMAAATFLTIDASIKEDLVENGGAPAETQEAKNFLLLEGLEPGSRIAG